MNKVFSAAQNGHVYRIDKFHVPEHARAEFLKRARATHDLLRKQPGFVRELLLEQVGGPGEFNIVTLVEWESDKAIEQAKEKVTAMHMQINFDPQELRARLGIRTDLGNYRLLDA